MARKKRILSTPRSAPWLNTFADLMNLLLCFFVMLFAFSDINVEKFEKVSMSFANSLGITDSSTGINKEEQIRYGMVQVPELKDYYEQVYGQKGQTSDTNQDGEVPSELDRALATLDREMEEATTKMYDKISDLTKQYHLTDYVELSMDPNYKYTQLTLKGSVLFDSGVAELKKEARPILTSIGDIMKNFRDYQIEITGYTDNVPMSENSLYKDNNWLSSARALNAAQYLIEQCGIDPSTLKYSGRGEYDPISSNATEEGRSKNRRIEFRIYNEYSR